MKPRQVLCGVAAFLACALIAGPAAAQYYSDDEVAAAWLILSTTTTGGALTTVGGVVLTVHLTKKDKKAMKAFLRDNAVALRHDISRGGGPTLVDLGHIFGIPEEQLGSFSRMVRARRTELLALVGPEPVDDAKAERFVRTVWSAVSGEEALVQSIADG